MNSMLTAKASEESAKINQSKFQMELRSRPKLTSDFYSQIPLLKKMITSWPLTKYLQVRMSASPH